MRLVHARAVNTVKCSTKKGLTEKCCTGDGACEIHGCDGRHHWHKLLKGQLALPVGDYIRRRE